MFPKKIILIFYTTFCLFAWFCQRIPFEKVEVRGRLIGAGSNIPLQVKVELHCDDATSAKDSEKNVFTIATTTSNSDGSFTLKATASRRNTYYLYVKLDSLPGAENVDVKTGKLLMNMGNHAESFSANTKGITDLGDLFIK